MWTLVVYGNSLSVLLCGVTLVFGPIVLREFRMNFLHVFVPMCFGEYRSSGNAEVLLVSFYYAFMYYKRIGLESISVYEKDFWFILQLIHTKVHSLKSGLQDVDLIDSLFKDVLDGPGQGMLLDIGPESSLLFLTELLRIVQSFQFKICW